MKSLVSVFTILVGLVIIGFSLENLPTGPAPADLLYNRAQIVLGIGVVIAGLFSIRRS